MKKSARQKLRKARAKRIAARSRKPAQASASSSFANPAKDGEAKETGKDTKKHAIQGDNQNRTPRKAYRMSNFLSILLFALAALAGGIAIAFWQKGGYRNYCLALGWGIGTWILLGVGAAFTYYVNVIVPARNPSVVETVIRGLLSPALTEVPTKAGARDDIAVVFGTSIAFFSEPTATLFKCGDEEILSFERVSNGVYVNGVIQRNRGGGCKDYEKYLQS